MDIKYQHVYNGNQPKATIAFCLESSPMLAGVSYCNPNDNFSKALGRVKAEGRVKQLLVGTKVDDEDMYFASKEGEDESRFKLRVATTVEFMIGVEQ